MSLNLSTHAHCMHAHLCWLPRRVITVLCVCPWHWQMREGCEAKISFFLCGDKYIQFCFSFCSPTAISPCNHPDYHVFGLSIVLSRDFFSFLPFTSFQVNRKDPISWSNWIHYHFNNPEQWESYSHCYEPDIKNEIRRMGGWHRRAAKRALMREVTRGLSEVWKPEQRVRNGEGEN